MKLSHHVYVYVCIKKFEEKYVLHFSMIQKLLYLAMTFDKITHIQTHTHTQTYYFINTRVA